jgi:hypothetical protein
MRLSMTANILAALCLFAGVCNAQNITALDAKNGFRDVVFGDTITKFTSLKMFEDSGSAEYYTRTTDDLSAGGATIDRIVYGFYKGRVFSVMLTTKGYANGRTLLQMLRSLYGQSNQPNRDVENYYWMGDTCTLTYAGNPITSNATISYISRRISAQMQADAKLDALIPFGRF